MSTKLNLTQAEKILADKYVGALCLIEVPSNVKLVSDYGIVDSISFDIRKLPNEKLLVVIVNNHRYEISLEELSNCVKILKAKENGNT